MGCLVCNNNNVTKFLDLNNQPLANSLLDTPDQNEEKYPLSLNWCNNCNLVQLDYIVDPKRLFSNYVWVTGTSSTARNYANIFYKEIITRVPNLNKGLVVEIASNDGTFLKPFIENKHTVLGVDPAENIIEVAKANNVPSKLAFFGESCAKEIIRDKGHAKVIFARNVIAHVANIHSVINGIYLLLEADGVAVLEVHYAKKIQEELQYDSIYHEHLCYFTLKSIEYLLAKHKLYVFDVHASPISGGALVVYAKKTKGNESLSVQKYRNSEKETKLNEFDTWCEFASNVLKHKEDLLSLINDIKSQGKTIVAYGASARSSTLTNFCEINKSQITSIADQNQFKHNKYAAGTHIPILPPDVVMASNPSVIVILAWNFAKEIIGTLKSKYNFKGTCIIPLPTKPQIVYLN